MLPMGINDITIEDLQRLIDESFLEMKTLEYKQNLPGNSDDDKKEFLYDISSFANSSGGDLIYGISEENHIPKALVGVKIEDIDAEIRRLEGIIRDGIRPRIPNIIPCPILINSKRYAIVFRIPKSWLNPHMVTLKNSSKFYTRASNGKYQLDVDQLRSAFTQSESKIIRIKEFVQSRLSEILSENYPIPMHDFPKIIMHIIPLSSTEFSMPDNFNILSTQSIFPLCSSGATGTYVADGYLSYSSHRDEHSMGYVLIFRNGSIEAVSSFLSKFDTNLSIPLTLLENQILNRLASYLQILKMLKIEVPIYVFLHLIGVKGLSLPKDPQYYNSNTLPIQKNFITLPNVELLSIEFENDETEYLTKILKLPFDALANAVGLPYSRSYDNDGKWAR